VEKPAPNVLGVIKPTVSKTEEKTQYEMQTCQVATCERKQWHQHYC